MEQKLRNMTSVFLTDDDGILCLYRIGSRVADKMYIGSAGGHFEEWELNDPKACALREMEEELGLHESDVEGLTLRYIALRLKNGEVRQNYYFFARLTPRRSLSSTEGILWWVPYGEVSGLDMPASAKYVMDHYLREGRYTDHLYGGIAEPDGANFVVLKEF